MLIEHFSERALFFSLHSLELLVSGLGYDFMVSVSLLCFLFGLFVRSVH